MEIQATRHSTKILKAAEGKTKILYRYEADPNRVFVEAKDDITAGDGAKHDVLPGKAEWATETTCNVFKFLKWQGVPTAFLGRASPIAFNALWCDMLPYEVVVRREAHGSFLKRHPGAQQGSVFYAPMVEWYLKTSGRTWEGYTLPVDDPLLHVYRGGGVGLYHPSEPITLPFLTLEPDVCTTLLPGLELQWEMEGIAKQTFSLLERAWHLRRARLVDMKIEFGIDHRGVLRVADVIDNDSWRIIMNGAYADKQVYRDGGVLDIVSERYQLVANESKHLALDSA